jgi:hypothetical protein
MSPRRYNGTGRAADERARPGSFGFSFSAFRRRAAVIAIKLGEIGGQFVAQQKPARFDVPLGVRKAAALYFDCKGGGPSDGVGDVVGHGFQQHDGAKRAGTGRERSRGIALDHLDLGPWLIGRAQMRL